MTVQGDSLVIKTEAGVRQNKGIGLVRYDDI
jgi:hypothetical protein